MLKNKKSKIYYKQALKLMPAGVNSPVRAFGAVGGDPLFIKKGKGSRLFDVDGNSYIDYVLSWGPLILGHAQKKVVQAISRSACSGTSFGAPHPGEIEIARLIRQAFSSMEKMRLVSSGTEAVMSAIRLARAYTKKDKIIKFEGCYHGHSDSVLVKAGSGATTFGVSTSAGVLADAAKNTIVLEFNDKEAVRSVLNSQHKQIAAIILEPVCGNMGVVLPNDDFLIFLRKITEKHNILLIFDEVITGFRFCFGGAQKLFKVRPDITCLGKIIGGGLPIGAYGGNSSIMEQVSPLGKMYQAGTLSGNPVAVTAGIETLRILKNADYKKLNSLCDHLCKEISAISKDICVNHIGPMFTIFFTKHCVNDYKQAMTADIKRYAGFFHALLNQGVYFAPSQFEANFVSFAHTKKDIEYTLRVIRKVLKRI